MIISKQRVLHYVQNKSSSFRDSGLDEGEEGFILSICNSNPEETVRNAHVIRSIYGFLARFISPSKAEHLHKETLILLLNMSTNSGYPYLLTATCQSESSMNSIVSESKFKQLLLQLFFFGMCITSISSDDVFCSLLVTMIDNLPFPSTKGACVVGGGTSSALVTAVTSILSHVDLCHHTFIFLYNKLLDRVLDNIDNYIPADADMNLGAILNAVTYILIQRYELLLDSQTLLPTSDLFSRLAWLYDGKSYESILERYLNPVLYCYSSMIFRVHFGKKRGQDAIVEGLKGINTRKFHDYMRQLNLKHFMLGTGISFKFYTRQYDTLLPASMPSFDNVSTVIDLIKHSRRAMVQWSGGGTNLHASDNALNVDVWSYIISYCNVIALCRFQCVCKAFNNCVRPVIWKNIYLKRFPKCFFRDNSRLLMSKDDKTLPSECQHCYGVNNTRGKLKTCCVSSYEKHDWKKLLKDRLLISKTLIWKSHHRICPVIGCLEVLKSKKSLDCHLFQKHFPVDDKGEKRENQKDADNDANAVPYKVAS